jgi:hypothetical protein
MLCDVAAHDWVLEQATVVTLIKGASGHISTLKFRCEKCNATIEGDVKR